MLRIRDARPDDADAVAAVHVAAWQDTYRGMLPDDYLDALRAEDRLPWWRDRLASPPEGSVALVAEDDDTGEVLGFSTALPNVERGDGWAKLPQIYLARAARGRGVGQELMAAMLDRTAELGYEQIELGVHPGNARARRFYEAGGWTDTGREVTDPTSWGVDFVERRYTRRTGSA